MNLKNILSYIKNINKKEGCIKMNLRINNLENCFTKAKELNYKYVAVVVDMQGFEKPEIIINTIENFDEKLAYYKKAYDENLILKSFNGIRIVAFTMADTFEGIEDDLGLWIENNAMN